MKTAVDSSVLLDVFLLGVRFEAIRDGTALAAGRLWGQVPRRVNGVRRRLMADFLVGAHAMSQADALLSRDHGFYRQYFQIDVIDPSVD